MVVTAKQLRLRTSEVLKKVQKMGTLTVTLRGKPVARLTALNQRKAKPLAEFRAFGMWADRKDIKDPSAWVRKIRRPRYSLH
jgi:prevent-host-death family protein